MRALCLLLILAPGLAQAQAVIATRMMKPGSVIGAADVALVDADIPGAISTLDGALGQAVTEVIYPGRPVLADNLEPPQIVARNQIVSLIYQAGPLRIFAQGRALSAGAAGDEIKIMNINSHATVTGLIGADGTVHVSRPQE
jgi:flagellar basal body P-ring formation protein FlgA